MVGVRRDSAAGRPARGARSPLRQQRLPGPPGARGDPHAPGRLRGPGAVKPPVVQAAGLLRAQGRGIETIAWVDDTAAAGQHLYHPPNIAGWREDRWLDTASLRARWRLAYDAITGKQWAPGKSYAAKETPEQAVAAALAFWDDPPLRADTRAVLLDAALRMASAGDGLTAAQRNGYRQNVLRHLVAGSHDHQVS